MEGQLASKSKLFIYIHYSSLKISRRPKRKLYGYPMESRRNKAGRSLQQREITNIQTLKQDNRTSPSTQMHRKLEDSRTPTTADNIKENINTLYDGHNTAKKQPEPLRPSLDQLGD